MFTFFVGRPPPYFPNAADGTPEADALKRYFRYIMARYGAYTDIWEMLNENDDVIIVLLAGPYEDEVNQELYDDICERAKGKANRIINPGTENSVMEFCGIINVCDIIVTSITMGMHVAIALRKKLVVLNGPIVNSEIDTFGLGPILTSKKHKCLGCFRDKCDIKPSCMEAISVKTVYSEVMKHWKK